METVNIFTKIKVAFLSLLLAVALIPPIAMLMASIIGARECIAEIVTGAWVVGTVCLYRLMAHLQKVNDNCRAIARWFWIYTLVLIFPWWLVGAIICIFIAPLAPVLFVLVTCICYYYSMKSLTEWYADADSTDKKPFVFLAFTAILTGCVIPFALNMQVVSAALIGACSDPDMRCLLTLLLTFVIVVGFVVCLIDKLKLSWRILWSCLIAIAVSGFIMIGLYMFGTAMAE